MRKLLKTKKTVQNRVGTVGTICHIRHSLSDTLSQIVL